MKLTRGQLILCIVGMLVSIGIFMLPGTSTDKKAVTAPAVASTGLKAWQDSSFNAIKSKQIILADLDEQYKAAQGDKKIILSDSISSIMLQNQQPWTAADYQFEKASITGLVTDWNNAGMTYYKAAKFAPAEFTAELTDKAIESFAKALEKDPSNNDIKTSMAICYVENGKDPMKGIGMLREVLQADPENVSAHMNLGYFSIQSGQYEKAIERFEKVLQLRPEMIEAYLYLGESYAGLGRKDKAIEVLQEYKSKSGDEAIKAQVDSYINELKTS